MSARYQIFSEGALEVVVVVVISFLGLGIVQKGCVTLPDFLPGSQSGFTRSVVCTLRQLREAECVSDGRRLWLDGEDLDPRGVHREQPPHPPPLLPVRQAAPRDST